MKHETIKPIIKWAGGKTNLLPKLQENLPKYINEQDFCLIEPFIGGGAMSLWALSHLPYLNKLIINDYNGDLINVYQAIKNNPYELVDCINKIQNDYDELLDLESKKPYFYQQRALFNTRESHAVLQASLFIFLNKAAFNGLYRVNKNNQFNVPIGSYKKPQLIDADNLINISKKLQGVEILVGDFSQVINHLPKNLPCFFYLDPPYRPISETSNFNSYAHQDFDDNEQIRLAEFCKKIHQMGHQFLLSNSDPKNTNPLDDFFDNLYMEFTIQRIQANRAISAKSDGRKMVSEILVKNYV